MKNTAIQEAIIKLNTLIAMWQDPSNEMDFEHTLKTYKSELESLLEKETQDLIEAHYEGQKECSNEFAMESDAKLYYNQTFKQ